MLFYVPLEGYKERYTCQWAAPKTGWLERNWIKAGIDYTRIDPLQMLNKQPRTIKTGSVVDGVGRSTFCFQQIIELLSRAEAGQIKDSDVILFDDFWTPGLEALPYAFHLLGIRPRMYAFLHAQSVDQFDFTFPMRSWMRPIEKGFAASLDGIFVCCQTLKDLVVFGGIAESPKVHVTGHPFSSEEVMERMPDWYRHGMHANYGLGYSTPRKDQVVWSSRWDREKNPMFFLSLAKEVITQDPKVKFIVCTSTPQLRSNSSVCLTTLHKAVDKYPDNIILKEGLSKEEYYQILTESKIQFNCADQDFVAITLLEASVAGCYPIYPDFRSFPETFQNRPGYMYDRLNLDQAVGKIQKVLQMDDSHWSRDAIKERSWIHSRFDVSWIRMLEKMNLLSEGRFDTSELLRSRLDPFREINAQRHEHDKRIT